MFFERLVQAVISLQIDEKGKSDCTVQEFVSDSV